jgi:hypothetical protein
VSDLGLEPGDLISAQLDVPRQHRLLKVDHRARSDYGSYMIVLVQYVRERDRDGRDAELGRERRCGVLWFHEPVFESGSRYRGHLSAGIARMGEEARRRGATIRDMSFKRLLLVAGVVTVAVVVWNKRKGGQVQEVSSGSKPIEGVGTAVAA